MVVPGRKKGRRGVGLESLGLALVAMCILVTRAVMPVRAPHAGASGPAARELADAAADDAAASADTLRVHFYDVSQGLAALVDLPGGSHLLVDTGDAPRREGCGADCSDAHRHLLGALAHDLRGAAIDLLWITHQHSDHIGGARDILRQFRVKDYVDNGRDGTRTEVARTRDVARARGTVVHVSDPAHPFDAAFLSPVAHVTPVLPPAWPSDCATDANECSLALRVDFGASSILFTGDAEHGEERELSVGNRVTLLQVGHHGSETSSTDAFLARVAPRYAVISAGRPDVGMNAEYCLPRATTIEKLNRVLGPPTGRTLLAFDGRRACRGSHGEGWLRVPASDRVWATERDGDVVLTTHGDGVFIREEPPAAGHPDAGS